MLTTEKEAIISKIIKSLEKYALGDIEKSLNQNMIIATFTLSSCFIDYLVSHRYYDKIKGTDEKWVDFINNYFPPLYFGKGRSLYNNLRCKIVHNYSANRVYALGRNEGTHMTKRNSKIYLDGFVFANDLKMAFKKYKNELKTNDYIKRIALAHFKKYSIFNEEK